MASLERRLRQLEAHHETLRRKDEDAVSWEVIGRLSYEELSAYDAALGRVLESGESAEGDRPILERVQQLYEEVASAELTSAS